MLVSYVLRLVPEEMADGRLVGAVEVVRTGERRAIHGFEGLMGFCSESYGAMSPARQTEKKGER